MNDSRSGLDRRTFLAAVGGLSALCAGCSAPADPADEPVTLTAPPTEQPAGSGETPRPTTRAESREETVAVDESAFESVVDAVADAGCDPSGAEPCQLAVQSALTDGTLLRFPAGSYLFTGGVFVSDVSRIGVVGDGDVRFVVPEAFADRLFEVEPADEVLFRNVVVDQRASGASTGVKLYTREGFHLEDVEFVGRGLTPAPRNRACLVGVVTNPEKLGVVRNLVATAGSAWNRYKNAGGKTGVFVGTHNNGRIRIEDCHFEEMGGNGIYASRHQGTTEVVGGTFRNNNVASIRIGGAGSFVDGATIEIDGSTYTGPRSDASFALRGIVIEQGANDTGGFKPAGAIVRNCDVTVNPNPTPGDAIQVWAGGRSLAIEDTTIRVDNPGSIAVNRLPAHPQGRHPAGPVPRWVRMRNVTITGRSAEQAAVRLHDAHGSRIESCDIRQRGANRDGVDLVRSADCRIDGGRISTTRFPIRYETDGRRTTSGCLLTIGRRPALETTALSVGPSDGIVGGVDDPVHRPGTSPGGAGCPPSCVRLATESVVESGPVVAGITDIRCGTVYGVVGSAAEVEDALVATGRPRDERLD